MAHRGRYGEQFGRLAADVDVERVLLSVAGYPDSRLDRTRVPQASIRTFAVLLLCLWLF